MKIFFQKKPDALYERLICWWTRGPYYHCSLVFGDNIMIEAAPLHGVRMVIQGSYDPDFWDVFEIPMSASEEEKIKAWAVKEVGCKYDWSGLFWAQILHIPRSHPDKWFCSEFCVEALQQIGKLSGIKPCTISPNDLAKLLK